MAVADAARVRAREREREGERVCKSRERSYLGRDWSAMRGGETFLGVMRMR